MHNKVRNPLINNEKHYLTMHNYCLNRFGKKTYRISLNGGFSCPNRDGKLSYDGCLFCSASGSGDFAGDRCKPLTEQFNEIKTMMQKKWSDGYYIAYFQANTNTYGSLDKLKSIYSQIITNDGPIDNKIKILSIATRPDCIDDEIIDYLIDLNKKVEVWIELGFQTANENTASYLNRGYRNNIFFDTVKKLKKVNIHTIVHIINGLPGETEEDMINTVKLLNNLNIDGIKIHMLHIMKNTPLGSIYENKPFPLLSLDEYVKIVSKQLQHLNDNIVIHRITGDAPKDLLIEPTWTLKKFIVMNEIDKYMRKNNIYQGDLCLK